MSPLVRCRRLPQVVPATSFRETILELRLVVQERSLTRHLLLPEFREGLDA
jgi:hypothetical protein